MSTTAAWTLLFGVIDVHIAQGVIQRVCRVPFPPRQFALDCHADRVRPRLPIDPDANHPGEGALRQRRIHPGRAVAYRPKADFCTAYDRWFRRTLPKTVRRS
jgi:hypothetical protein